MKIFARKRFGQHFLHDRSVLDRIVRELAPGPDDALVEIGPGRGALTVRFGRTFPASDTVSSPMLAAWTGRRDGSSRRVPTAGEILAGLSQGFDGKAYDEALPERVRQTLY